MAERTKYMVVHGECVYNKVDHPQWTSKQAIVQRAVHLIEGLKDLPSVTVDETSSISDLELVQRLREVDVLVDNMSAHQLGKSGIASSFAEDADRIVLVGAFRDICVQGVCNVLGRLGINFEVLEDGTLLSLEKY